ncbi:hypothetical protein [Spirosoma telluris]|uniref:hypothetical protein n=1 Tax=Spirosoma telluris TaxID=2183553 RepID=UPI002FD4424B
MHRYRMSTARLIIAGLFISFSTQAQKIELGASLGGMLCKGDVTPAMNPRFISPAVGGFFGIM